jgi:Na+/H+ antiporter NhaD/arsenite permease-like protein
MRASDTLCFCEDPVSTLAQALDDVEVVEDSPAVVMLSGWGFVLGCAAVSAIILLAGRWITPPLWFLAAEVLATILGLFLLGSFKYQVHKNALTYGMLLVIIATFSRLSTSEWHVAIRRNGWWQWARLSLLSFRGLDELIHADTMLFILGLTLFVAVIAQTRLLEGITFALLRRNEGAIAPTVLSVTAFVAVASAVIGGVSMIGLTIRILVIVLLLAAAPTSAIRYAVIVCTAVTTICGVWMAYGEPPNLIMKANLHPLLGNLFFLIYCAPAAIVSYLLIARQLRIRTRNQRVFLELLDVIEANAQDVRFLQAARHGEALTPIEFVENHAAELGEHTEGVLRWLHEGESLGLSLFRENVPETIRKSLLGHFVSEELADSLDRHYQLAFARDLKGAAQAERAICETLASLAHVRLRAQKIGAMALLPFLGLLVLHGIDDRLPLFWASFAGFLCALWGITGIPKMRTLALHEAYVEYAEYYFLFPLFLSITLLTKAGFFDQIQILVHKGIESMGQGHVAIAQFLGCTFLSAILDNNIVADFASRGLHGLSPSVLHLFAMAQIVGYALGGCWTHIGCAQSVVAFAFIRRDVDEGYTPLQWIKDITPIMVQVLLALMVVVYAENALLRWLQ